MFKILVFLQLPPVLLIFITQRKTYLLEQLFLTNMAAGAHWLPTITGQNLGTFFQFFWTVKTAHPGGKGPVLTAGTLGGATGLTLLVGCLVEVAAEVLVGVEDLSEPANGLISEAAEGTKGNARAGVSEPD